MLTAVETMVMVAATKEFMMRGQEKTDGGRNECA